VLAGGARVTPVSDALGVQKAHAISNLTQDADPKVQRDLGDEQLAGAGSTGRESCSMEQTQQGAAIVRAHTRPEGVRFSFLLGGAFLLEDLGGRGEPRGPRLGDAPGVHAQQKAAGMHAHQSPPIHNYTGAGDQVRTSRPRTTHSSTAASVDLLEGCARAHHFRQQRQPIPGTGGPGVTTPDPADPLDSRELRLSLELVLPAMDTLGLEEAGPRPGEPGGGGLGLWYAYRTLARDPYGAYSVTMDRRGVRMRPAHVRVHVHVHVHVKELRLGFSNTTRNPEGILSHSNRKS
jgi:hypothetical protein